MLLLVGRQLGGRSVGQELETCFIEVLLVFLSAIVVREDFAECGVHLRVDVTLRLDLLLDLVEDLQAVVVKTQIQLLFSLRNSAQVDGIFEVLKTFLGLFEELDRDIDVFMLS